MKKTTFLLWGILLYGISSYSQTQFWSDTFEDSGTPSSGIRNAPTAFFNSVNQFFNRLDNTAISCTSGAYTNVEGSKFWAGEDTDGGQTITVANVLKTVTWTGISISGKTNISLKGLFAVGNNNTNVFDNGSASSTGVYDYMSIQYAIDGGPIQNLLNFYPLANSNSSLYIDANFDGIGDANTTPLSNTFTEYTGQINGTGNTLTLYLNMSLTGFSEEVAVDNLRLLTTPTCNVTITPASQTNIACNGGSNGAASVNNASGGTAPYTYNWTPDNPTGDGTTSVTGLTAGTWTCTVTDANSCTTSQSFTITQPTAINTSVTQADGMLTATETGATYQWYSCPDNVLINNETNQTLIPTVLGNYQVEITVGNCSAVSDCITVTTLGNHSFEPVTNFIIYPNPTDEYINIQLNEESLSEVVIYAITGQKNIESKINKVDVSSLPKGVYMVKVKTISGNQTVLKFIKE